MADNNDNKPSAAHVPEVRGAHVHPTPQYTPGHQPGQKVGNEAVPEHKVEVLPAGSAPADKTFVPNPTSEVPGQASNPNATATTDASATLTGATSGDVNTGLGKPIQGQSSAELHHDGHAHRERTAAGLQGIGASGAGHADQAYSGNRVPVEEQYARDDRDTVRH